MSVFFRHLNTKNGAHTEASFTLAVDVPTKADLLDYVDSQFEDEVSPLDVEIGVARCHPNDQYNKKTGRQTAQSLMAFEEFTFNSIHQREGRHLYNFHAWVRLGQYDYCVTLVFSTVPHSDWVKLEKASVS